MIVYAMLYTVAVGVPVLLATWVLAAVLRRYGRPERLVWLAGLVLASVLPVLGLIGTGDGPGGGDAAAASGPGSSTGVIGLPEILVVPEGVGGAGLTELIVALWAVTSLLLAARLAVAALRLARAGRSWTRDTMDGVPVWLTEEVGPAVAGLVRPRVLAPGWLVRMPTRRRSLVLLHELEHIRARDPWLMLLSRVAPIVTPWNPVVWLLSSRLLRAIELDCDRRVLRHRPDVRTYGATLIEISARDRGRLVAVAAFAESEAPLRSRILNMTTPSRAVSIVALVASMMLGAALMTVAFQIPVPAIGVELAMGAEPAASPVIDLPSADGAEPTPAQDAAAGSRRSSTEAPPDAREALERLRREQAPRADAARRQAEAAAARLELERASGTEETYEPPPPDPDVGATPTFTPFTVAPELLNMAEVQGALAREYPTVLRDSGIGGRVLVWFFIDEEGRVRQTQINESSGYQALDQAALDVATVYRFSPAMNRERRTPVWVALPITFQVR